MVLLHFTNEQGEMRTVQATDDITAVQVIAQVHRHAGRDWTFLHRLQGKDAEQYSGPVDHTVCTYAMELALLVND
jgi:hypothetical protein